MRIVIAGAILCAVAGGCAREYEGTTSFPSPDGRYVLDITREIQPANDPDVYWQHISIRSADSSERIVPGNVAVYSGRSTPEVKWISAARAELIVNGTDVGQSFDGPPKEKSIDGIVFVFSVRGKRAT